jgi:3-oxoadipate enol-lactonase
MIQDFPAAAPLVGGIAYAFGHTTFFVKLVQQAVKGAVRIFPPCHPGQFLPDGHSVGITLQPPHGQQKDELGHGQFSHFHSCIYLYGKIGQNVDLRGKICLLYLKGKKSIIGWSFNMKRILFFPLTAVLMSCMINITSSAQSLNKGYVEVDKGRLYFEEMGKGKALIMIHGGLIDRRMWDQQFEEFAKHFRVIRYDARNHGLSESEPGAYVYYEDLKQLCDRLHIQKAALLGLSMGGRVAIDFSIAYPEKVWALVLAAPGVSGYSFDSKECQEFNKKYAAAYQSGSFEKMAEAFLQGWTDGPYRKPSEVDPKVRNKTKQMALDHERHNGSEVGMGELDPPALNRLDEIKAPTLAIAGDLDMPDILDIVNRVDKHAKNSQKEIINGAAHMINMEKPEEFNKLVLDFLLMQK